MKKLKAPFISQNISNNELGNVSTILNQHKKQGIDNLLWDTNNYKPTVSFSIVYDHSNIFIKYFVTEDSIRAFYSEINDPVYKDSCVELFIAFENDTNYYNLEFNCIGTALVGYGSGRENRLILDKDTIKRIKTLSSVKSPDINSTGPISWELTIAIPFDVFVHHQITSLKEQVCSVNFYKCGDELPKPHYLSWNNIDNPNPDFHLPEFFGEVIFD